MVVVLLSTFPTLLQRFESHTGREAMFGARRRFAARAVALHNMVLPLGAGRSFPSLRPEPTTACLQAPLGPLGGWPSHVLPPALRTTVIYHTMARRSTRMNSHLSKEPGRALLALRTDAPGLELWTILGGSIPNQRKLLFRDGRTKLFRTTGFHGRKQQAAEWCIATSFASLPVSRLLEIKCTCTHLKFSLNFLFSH